MTKADNVSIRRSVSDRAIAMAFGSLLLVPVIYALPVDAADLASSVATTAVSADESVRPFQVHVPQSQLDDLRRRIADTRWPDKETVGDDSQGIQLSRVQDLVRYWGTEYDWRKTEAQLNALPEFITTIDGVDIQFIHGGGRA